MIFFNSVGLFEFLVAATLPFRKSTADADFALAEILLDTEITNSGACSSNSMNCDSWNTVPQTTVAKDQFLFNPFSLNPGLCGEGQLDFYYNPNVSWDVYILT